MPMDAWVDNGNRIRRMSFTMKMKLPQTPQAITMNIQEDLYDFGTTVDATPPPSDDVFDATGAAAKAIQQSGLGG